MKTENGIIIESLSSYIDSLKKQLLVYENLIDRFVNSPANKIITEEDIDNEFLEWQTSNSHYVDRAFSDGANWAISRMKDTGVKSPPKHSPKPELPAPPASEPGTA